MDRALSLQLWEVVQVLLAPVFSNLENLGPDDNRWIYESLSFTNTILYHTI